MDRPKSMSARDLPLFGGAVNKKNSPARSMFSTMVWSFLGASSVSLASSMSGFPSREYSTHSRHSLKFLAPCSRPIRYCCLPPRSTPGIRTIMCGLLLLGSTLNPWESSVLKRKSTRSLYSSSSFAKIFTQACTEFAPVFTRAAQGKFKAL